MGQERRYAWSWTIKEECLHEYVEMHLNPWSEIMTEHSKAGIHDYSISGKATSSSIVFKCADVDSAFNYLADSDVRQRWNAITTKMVEESFDLGEEHPIEFLPEVFRLE